jgi:hypothetical protein
MDATMKKLLLFLTLLLLTVSKGFSQWVSDTTINTPVCRATGNQTLPQGCTDGNDGAYIVWADYRTLGHNDIYLQHLDHDGRRTLAENGILISDGTHNATNPVICKDDSGGAFIAWQDYRTSTNGPDIYSQRIKADGTMSYTAGGTATCKVDGIQENLVICSDGRGAAFLAWEDNRSAITSSSRPDIYMNRLTATGPVWGTAGAAKITLTLKQTEPRLIDDGQGGCLLLWLTNSGGLPNAVFGSRVSSTGTVLWGYQNQGIQIHRGDYSTKTCRNPRVTRDGNEFVVGLEEAQVNFSTHGYDILVNRVRMDSTRKWYTAAQVTPTIPGDQINCVPMTDNNGGALVAYENYSGTKDIAVTHVLPDGATIKPSPNPVFPVCNLGNDQYGIQGILTSNGMMLVWMDERNAAGQPVIYMNSVDTTPSRLLWPTGSSNTSRWGIPVSVSTQANVVRDQMTIIPRTNGAIVVWRDNRNSSSGQDIYAQLIFKNGTLPIELADFSLSSHWGGTVLINWHTAMEKDNAGFDIERRLISDASASDVFEVVASYKTEASLRGVAGSNSLRAYNYLDKPGKAGVYEYRLVDNALDGERTYHQTKQIEIGSISDASEWKIEPNFPNPFRDNTEITIETPRQAIVDLTIFDAMGRVVSSPYKHQLLDKGFYNVGIGSHELGASSGVFFYMMTATDPETGNLLWKMNQSGRMVKIAN